MPLTEYARIIPKAAMNHVNTKTLRWLIVLGGLLTAASWVIDRHNFLPWLSGALLGIGTGFFGAISAVYGYEVLVARRHETERQERERREVKALAVTVRQHYRVLLDCYRSSYDGSEVPMFADVNEFLGQQYQPVIQSLDIYAASPANSAGSTPYYAYIESSFKQLSSALH